MKIGTTIKRLRIEKGLTQEKLAEILGVSPQAVSRWENSSTYPDINMLPSIAMFFDVSADELLGMDDIRSHEQISNIYTKVHRLIENNKVDDAISELRSALKAYPNDYGFMSELSLALTIHKDYNASPKHLSEAVELSERILQNSTNDKLRSTVKANLCFTYLKYGNEEKALKLAKTLPHVWESREMLVPEINNEEIDNKLFKQGITTTLNVIYSKIINAQNSDKLNSGKMLILGPEKYEDIPIQDKINTISEYLV